MKLEEKNKAEKYESKIIFDAIKSIFGNIIAFASGLIGLFGVICFVGWTTSRGYYSKFGANWLTNSQTIFQIAEFSFIPLVFFSVALILKLSDIFDRANKLEESFFWKNFAKILVVTAVLVLIVHLTNEYFIKLPKEIFIILNMIWIGVFFIALLETIEALIYFTVSKNKNIEKMWIFTIYILGLFGLYFYPYLIGDYLGSLDVNPDNSKLPIVKKIGDKGGPQLRFLFKSESHVYAAEFKKDGPPYQIKIIPVDKIDYIEPHHE